jgi:uncharacterized protein YlzI (FlbEa/FlbD family)
MKYIRINDIRNLVNRYIFIDKITSIHSLLDETYIYLQCGNVVVTNECVSDVLEKIERCDNNEP